MLNEIEQEVFFSLLRAGLWGGKVDRLELFPLTDLQWQRIIEHAIHQTVDGLIFSALNQLPMELSGSKGMMFELAVRSEKIEQRNQIMNESIAQQARFFQKLKIEYLLLKGQGLAACYLNPKLRVCGDVDWYFERSQDYNKLIQELKNRGVRINMDTDHSANLVWNGFEVDLHQKLFDLHNPFLKKRLKKFEELESSKSKYILIEKEKVYLPSVAIQIVQTNAHILKHLLSFGIGIRQLCDIARLYQQYQGAYLAEEIKLHFQNLGIYRWIKQLNSILVFYLGTPTELVQDIGLSKNVAHWMMKDILQSGNFGFYDSNYTKVKSNQEIERQSSIRKVSSNILRYFPYAPMEALSFPFVHFLSRTK